MATEYLTDRQWAFTQPFLPPLAHTGQPCADDRKTVEGMLYVLTTGCRWQNSPPEYRVGFWNRLQQIRRSHHG